jgi:hypothetical protein
MTEKIEFIIKMKDKEDEKCYIEVPEGKKIPLDRLADLFFWIGSCINSPIKSMDILLK